MAADSAYRGLKLAFLSYVETEKGLAGRGAALVTDHVTKPLEFRCTTPVRPSPVQRTLYGATLRSHIAVDDLVGVPLIGAIQERPQVVIVQDMAFLGLRPNIAHHMVCISKQGERFADESGGNSKESRDPGVLLCDSGRFQPLNAITHWEHSGELSAILEILRPVFSHADLLEPFARIEKAIAEVERQQPGR